MTLDRLALARSTLDRAAARRIEPGLLDALLADPSTAVLVLDLERAPVTDDRRPALTLVDPATATAFADTTWSGDDHRELLFLGDDAHGRGHLALMRCAPPHRGAGAPGAAPDPAGSTLPGTRWAGLREVGSLLDDTGAGLFTVAVAMANWHAGHRFCARCGSATHSGQAGWVRQCPACGAEHYPRTDGAVIMTVLDDAERILLGRQASWPAGRYSCLAGFVEPGESLEDAVRREVREEAGVVVGDVDYVASQPWPFPASLMLGFRGLALGTDLTIDGEELADARWWSREELALDVATGEVLLPPDVSIARRLIEAWFGGPFHDAGDAWR